MNIRILLVAFLLSGSVAFADPADDARYVAQVVKKVDDGVEKARAHPEQPAWYGQCRIDVQELEEAIQKLPEADRTPYLTKIKQLRPEIEAGMLRSRGFYLGRHIRDALDSAKEDLARTTIDPSTFETIDGYFADPDAKGIPPEEMKTLRADYDNLKKENAKKKKQ